MSEVVCAVSLSEGVRGSVPGQECLPEFEDWRDLSALSQNIWHPVYKCDIYCWLAMGSVIFERCRTEVQYFLYCEYRDPVAASQYVVYSFFSLSEALHFQQQSVAQQILPGIGSDQTRKRPVLKHH